MSDIYVVVADSSIAKVFRVKDKTGALVLVENLVSPESRFQDKELQSDKPGRAFDINGEGRHSVEGNRSPKQQISNRFAAKVANHIAAELQARSFKNLYLIAEPQFLGLLKAAISDEVASVISDSIPKNLTRHDLRDVRKALPAIL